MNHRTRTTTARLVFWGLDALSWLVAVVLAVWLRFEFDVPGSSWLGTLGFAALAIVLQSGIGYLIGLYRGRHVYGTFEEVKTVTLVALVVGLVTSLLVLIWGPEWDVPRSVFLIATPVALVGMLAARYLFRLSRERRMAPGGEAKPTIVYGAGYLGETMIRRMKTDPQSPFRAVALLDDDPHLSNLEIRGTRVMGGFEDLRTVAEQTGATDLVIAIGWADSDLVRRITDAATEAGLSVSVLPLLEEVMQGKTKLTDLRQISIEDLIGRHPVDTEVESIAHYIAGKRVLVTGAGGSIGSELCRQVLKHAPAELIMVDRDETGLQLAQLETVGHGLLHTKDVVLADIREPETMKRVFRERRPQVVYHAAALKHLPMLEQYPEEAWKTNVLGTLNVLEAARDVDVETFINISTDKAANPTSVLGHSKRVAEKLTAWMGEETERPYLSVRFGNVIGSRGSMLPTFRSLIEKGGPLTVTHPDITRYFMTIPEACQLVLQAGAIGSAGEVLILDMGEPVRIMDIAERMIEMSGKDIDIVFTGLREGEKMHEELVGLGEGDERPYHPKISHAMVQTLSPTMMDKQVWLDRCGKSMLKEGVSHER
ncbi:polysaccharide biosynthesis protein [Micrococcus terreus]|uniref:polysaccharide biosynthesis protein n=1 Tax=Micrococcus terreus TaxID=574650 RepID=UPI0021A2BB41|nr:nucleoside-diphosphate sugar epimerase/dehydratase [Micrococcus terreus]MCT2089346.1 polysaccharide biosynthesis protein [Micrococcus terreus]